MQLLFYWDFLNYVNDFDETHNSSKTCWTINTKIAGPNNIPSGGIPGSVFALLNDWRKYLENVLFAHNVLFHKYLS